MSEMESLLRRVTEQLDIAGYKCYVLDVDEVVGTGKPLVSLSIWEDD